MDLDELLDAKLELHEEEQGRKQRQIDGIVVRLAAVIGRADYALRIAHDDLHGLREAFETMRNQLAHLLAQQDIHLLGEAGEVIDPDRHEVEEVRPVPGGGPPRVAEVIDYGAVCAKDERLLQRARVVATVPSSKQGE